MPFSAARIAFVAIHKTVSLGDFSAKLFPTQALLQLGGSALHMSLTRICLCRMLLAQWRPKLPFTGCPSQGAQQQEWLTEWHFETETSHSFLLLKVL